MAGPCHPVMVEANSPVVLTSIAAAAMMINTLKLPAKSAQTKPNIATPGEKQKGKMTVRQKADQAEVEARTQREMLAARDTGGDRLTSVTPAPRPVAFLFPA